MNSDLSTFSHLLPIAGRCLLLRQDFNISLKTSFLYLLEACIEAIPEKLYNDIIEKINSLDCDQKFSGLLGVLHLQLYETVKQKNIDGVLEVCHHCMLTDFYVTDICYYNLSSFSPFYQKLLQKICSEEVVRENEYYILSSEIFKDSKIKIEKGLDLLKNHMADFYQEAQELVSEILLLNAKGIQAGTSANSFGMIHKNYTYMLDKITDIIDFLIHEQSHLYLHLLDNQEGLINNSFEKYESPLRKDPRPLIGIYHATFVLSRVLYVLYSLYERNLIPESEKEYCRQLTKHYLERFKVGFKILETHADKTILGQSIFLSTKIILDFSELKAF